MKLKGTESSPVINDSSEFQRWFYSIDHFHVPKFDSNGYCWMNTDGLRPDKNDYKNETLWSRELVCNFDRCNDLKLIKEKLGDQPWENTTKCYPTYRPITDCDEKIEPIKLTSIQSWLIALLVLVLFLGGFLVGLFGITGFS